MAQILKRPKSSQQRSANDLSVVGAAGFDFVLLAGG
jgi:hypothetical protein